ncbi:alpha/beta fold hydrolase [Bdellovibrio bacteriovorus]|uniref:alpha/beta fold hydrolase n=1 Tax=Bdellovibrio bacteriovorus TaxID=959 RepID=UPI0009BF26B2|nr:alpha/beta hydrolase [Bdellovibrio bacteriovorus]
MEFFKAKDQARIFFRDMGEGAPVILIHGWPLNADMFEYQTLDLLKKGFRVITYDRRGFGRSEQTASGNDYNTYADDLDSLINHLKLEKVSLVGFSMGGGEIARYLGRYGSSKISSAILLGAVTPYLLQDDSNPDGVEPKVFAQMISQIEEDRPAFFAQFTKMFFGVNVVKHPVSDETQQWCFNMATMASLKATLDCVTAFGHTDFRKDMKAFDIPTLIIHGTDDKIVPLKTSGEAAAKLVPQAIFKKYDGAPHGLFITHKQQLNSEISKFLDQNKGSVISKRIRTDETIDKTGSAISRGH